MGVSRDEASAIVDSFCEEYPAIREAVNFRVEDTQELLYGPQATQEAVGTILGGYTPGTRDQWGHVSRGRCDLALASVHSREEFRRTLRHELVGHLGLNAFIAEEKRSVLTAIAETCAQKDMAPFWAEVDKNYSFLASQYSRDEVDLRKAEEIYALACERIRPGHQADIGAGQQSLRETCIERTRSMQAVDLVRITEMVAAGLRDRTRSQLNFPRDPNA